MMLAVTLRDESLVLFTPRAGRVACAMEEEFLQG
jgi:hypothetical protein